MPDEKKTSGWMLLVALFSLPPLAILQGWVMSVLWRWFIAPTFGLREISIPAAIGISLLMGVVRPPHTPRNMTWDSLGRGISNSVYFPLALLLLGLIVRLWM